MPPAHSSVPIAGCGREKKGTACSVLRPRRERFFPQDLSANRSVKAWFVNWSKCTCCIGLIIATISSHDEVFSVCSCTQFFLVRKCSEESNLGSSADAKYDENELGTYDNEECDKPYVTAAFEKGKFQNFPLGDGKSYGCEPTTNARRRRRSIGNTPLFQHHD